MRSNGVSCRSGDYLGKRDLPLASLLFPLLLDSIAEHLGSVNLQPPVMGTSTTAWKWKAVPKLPPICCVDLSAGEWKKADLFTLE